MERWLNRSIACVNFLLDLIYPAQCAACRIRISSRERWLCRECFMQLTFLDTKGRCDRCFAPSPVVRCAMCMQNVHYLFTVRALFEHSASAQALVRIVHIAPRYTNVDMLASLFLIQHERLKMPRPQRIIAIGRSRQSLSRVAQRMQKMMKIKPPGSTLTAQPRTVLLITDALFSSRYLEELARNHLEEGVDRLDALCFFMS